MDKNSTNEVKISVMDYIKDRTQLEIIYLPFDTKLEIVSQIINGVVKSIGGLNTSFLRRIAVETFIGSITNIDMNIADENGLKGYDQLCFSRKLGQLIIDMGAEYEELDRILNERIDDYIRMETNPAVTISAIYEQLQKASNVLIDRLTKIIQNIDTEQLLQSFQQMLPQDGGDSE